MDFFSELNSRHSDSQWNLGLALLAVEFCHRTAEKCQSSPLVHPGNAYLVISKVGMTHNYTTNMKSSRLY